MPQEPRFQYKIIYHTKDQESQTEWKKTTDTGEHWDDRTKLSGRILWQPSWTCFSKQLCNSWNNWNDRKSQQRNVECKDESNRYFLNEKNTITSMKSPNGWFQQQNGGKRGKNQWTWRQNKRYHPIWTEEWN